MSKNKICFIILRIPFPFYPRFFNENTDFLNETKNSFAQDHAANNNRIVHETSTNGESRPRTYEKGIDLEEKAEAA